jgi:NAD(P)-dependent dehydrogenase (short-subunit alcohol dehydrogenase family)
LSRPFVLIVGGGPRLGEAVARRFGRDGYHVGLIARDEERLVGLAERLGADGITASWHTAHVAEPIDLTAAIDALVDDAGRVDVVLHNISAWRDAPALELAPHELLHDLSVGAASLLTVAQAVAPAMRAAGRGTVLATGSGSADHPSPGAASLGPQKAALRVLIRSLAAELRPDGIHAATVTVRGAIADGTPLAPDRIADVYAELVAETAGPPSGWRTVVDLP